MRRLLNGVLGLIMVIVISATGIFEIFVGVRTLVRLNKGEYLETTAKILKIETEQVPDDDAPGGYREDQIITVEYTVNGKKVVATLNENPSEFYEGQELTILYYVNDPTQNLLPGSNGATYMIVAGSVAIVVSVIIFLKNIGIF